MADYHGTKPVTKSDAKIAKKHLKATIKLRKQEVKLMDSKIADHRRAASTTSNPRSKAYHRSHTQPHVAERARAKSDIRSRRQSLRTLSKLKFISG